MKNKFRAFLAILMGGLMVGGISVSAFDASEMDSIMTVSPPDRKIILVPGETYNGSIKVSNSNSAKSDLKYSVTIGSYGLAKDKDGKMDYNSVEVETVTGYNQIMNWITLGKESGTVSPNNSDVIPYTINVPLDAPAGGQYATILVQNDTLDEGGGSVTVKEKIRFASVIMADVAGENKLRGEIVNNSVPLMSFSNPLTVSSIVKNEGNVHADAKYVLQVWPLFSDEEIYSNEEEPMTSLILPESERMNTQSWEGAPMVGVFRVRQTVEFLDDVSVVEGIVIICPLWLLVIIILLVAAVVIWLIFKVKKSKN